MTEYQQKLVESNINLAYDYAHKHLSEFGYDIDDSIQIASVGLCNAAVNYDESKGFAFSTLAYTFMKNEFLTLRRRNNAKKRNACIVYLDDILYDDSDNNKVTISDTIPDGQSIEDQIIVKDQIEYAFNKLDDNCKQIIEYMIANPNLTQTECAKQLNTSQSRISKSIKKFKMFYNEF